ncbi:MAG: hypothetical protein JOY61_20280 [Chloroflexi bacterium]|nr:hypothetical protein [Chloroflexota bacterium]
MERVRFEHDGTLAAAGVVSDAPAAVIMLGTALGVGFVPSGHRLRAIASDFNVRAAHGFVEDATGSFTHGEPP